MNERTGFVYKDSKGHWWARVTFVDEDWIDPETGKAKRRDWKRRAENKSHAIRLRDELLAEAAQGPVVTVHSSIRVRNFAELAVYYQREYAKPPVFVDDELVGGMKSFYPIRLQIKAHILPYFGTMRLRSISYEVVRGFKNHLLDKPIEMSRKKERAPEEPLVTRQRSLANVHRILSTLRRMFHIAEREGWMKVNPFSRGEPLVNMSAESHRTRVLSREEEDLVIIACQDETKGRKYWAHMAPIIITALDSGMRKGEILKLDWSHIDFDTRTITIVKKNEKTARMRQVKMTSRVLAALRALHEFHGYKADGPVFSVSNVKKAFDRLRKKIGAADVRFHDLRHTTGTRMAQAGMNVAEIARILGHTQLSTAYRYINADETTLDRAVDALERKPVK